MDARTSVTVLYIDFDEHSRHRADYDAYHGLAVPAPQKQCLSAGCVGFALRWGEDLVNCRRGIQSETLRIWRLTVVPVLTRGEERQ